MRYPDREVVVANDERDFSNLIIKLLQNGTNPAVAMQPGRVFWKIITGEKIWNELTRSCRSRKRFNGDHLYILQDNTGVAGNAVV